MRHLLTDFMERQFTPYRERLDEESTHRGEIDRIIESRVNKLMEHDISFEELRTVMDKAKTMDRNASVVSGTVGGLPFALASSLQAAIPTITGIGANIQNPVAKAAAQGAISLAAASVMDQVGGASMKKLREDAYYLQAPADKLHDSLKVALETIDTKSNLAIKNAKEAQTFTARNAIRMFAGPITAKFAPEVEPILDTALSITGGLAAGAGTGYMAHNRRTEQLTSGPALLLGRRDAEPKQDLNQETEWFDALQALRGANTFSTPLANAGSRLVDAGRTLVNDPLGAMSRTAKGTFTASGAANVTTLTGGFAALEAAKGAAVDALAHQRPLGSFAKHAINTVGGSVVFGANAAGVAVGDKLVEDLFGQGSTAASPPTDATQIAQSVHEGADDASGEEPSRVSRPASQRSHRTGSDSDSLPRTSLTGSRITNSEYMTATSTSSPAESLRASVDDGESQRSNTRRPSIRTTERAPGAESPERASVSSERASERSLHQPAVHTDDSSDDEESVYYTAPSSPV